MTFFFMVRAFNFVKLASIYYYYTPACYTLSQPMFYKRSELFIKRVLPVGRDRAQPATPSFTLFWGGEGERKKNFAKPRYKRCICLPLLLIWRMKFHKKVAITQ